jgi:hypothetical protein
MEFKILKHFTPKSIPIALEIGGRKVEAMLIYFCLEFDYQLKKTSSAKLPVLESFGRAHS